jgi:predicted chitinase
MNFPEENIPIIISALEKYGIKNPYLQAGILSIVGTESGLVPKSEYSYRNTSVKRLREIFPNKLSKYSDSELESLKKDNIAFYNAIYGGLYGNSAYEDGYKYRGRGFNGITFRDAYKNYSQKLGIDLISNPDLLNTIPIAGEALAIYFRDNFDSLEKAGKFKARFGIDKASEVTDLDLASEIALQINAGFKTSLSKVPRLREELALAKEYNDYFYTFTKAPDNVNPVNVPLNLVTRVVKKKRNRIFLYSGITLAVAGLIGWSIYSDNRNA